jgi:type VI protein secretion system component VasA
MLERRATPASTSSSSPSTCSSRQPLFPPPHPVQLGHSRTVGKRVYIENEARKHKSEKERKRRQEQHPNRHRKT